MGIGIDLVKLISLAEPCPEMCITHVRNKTHELARAIVEKIWGKMFLARPKKLADKKKRSVRE